MSAPPYFQPDTIYCGDCVDVLRRFPEASVDLIYADPPFFSEEGYEILWHDGYERRAFEDRWKGGIQNYISWIKPKLEECFRILKLTGSMYLHCDSHADARLRVAMDDLFQDSNFRTKSSGKGLRLTRIRGRATDGYTTPFSSIPSRATTLGTSNMSRIRTSIFRTRIGSRTRRQEGNTHQET